MTTKPKTTVAKSTVNGKGVSDKKTAGIGKGTPGPGRPKGAANRENKLLREMILQALDENGGVEYLAEQARNEPKAFLSLLGRVLPLQVTGEGGGALVVEITRFADKAAE